MRTYFKIEAEDHSIGKILSKKKYGGTRVVSEKKRMLCMQNLTKEWRQLPVVILQRANFGNIFILCLWLTIITRSDQSV